MYNLYINITKVKEGKNENEICERWKNVNDFFDINSMYVYDNHITNS